MRLKAIGGGALLLLAASCDIGSQKEAAVPVARLPDQVCAQAKAGIDKLRESGGFVYKGGGEATIEDAAWLQLEPPAREQLEQILAYDAACTAKEPPAEQTATIRNETGRVLSQRVVETRADVSRILED